MRLHLSAIGWIGERPIGNRLRWHVPMGLHGGNVIRIPRFIEVQRAPLDRQDFAELKRATVPYPTSWWTARGDVLASIFSPGVDFGAGVQAVSFTYQGPATTVLLYNGSGKVLKRLEVATGEGVYVEGSDIRRVLVLAFAATLQNLRTLDLFADRPLDWKPIAQIAVDPGLEEAFANVVDRYQSSPTMTDSNWTDLKDLASEARSWDGTLMPDGEPTPYESLALMLALRWEFAVLAGFGFCDGPYRVTAPPDKHRDLLAQPPNTPVAYRVLSRGEPALTSNIAVCLPWNAAPLSAPAAPTYGSATVRLRAPNTSNASVTAIRGFSRLKFGSPYTVDTVLNWIVSDAQSIGVQVEEEHGASSVIAGSAPVHHSFTCRTRSKDDAPFSGALPRNFEVAFPDVAVRARASAIDGWDRVSPPSPYGPWCTPALDHSPSGPQIEEASYQGGTVTLLFSSWSPDAIVTATAGRVQILRQTAQPAVIGVGLGTAVPLQVADEDGWFEIPVSGATTPLAQFIGGTLSVGGISFPIHKATSTSVRIRVIGGTGAWYDTTRPAFLRQSASHPALWTPVTTLPAASIDTNATFSDPVPPPPKAKALTYATRVVYWGGRSGPVGGMRQALVQHPRVPVPPPFEVDFLGHDFFRRTLVRIRLSSSDPSGAFLVGAAQGEFEMSDTEEIERLTESVSFGLSGPRQARGGTELLDVLNLPVPLNQSAPMTFVVQRVTDYGASAYSVAVVPVPALTAG